MDELKRYKLAIVCGRFQPIHNGHKTIIDTALSVAEQVGVFIGSSNNTGTRNNPLTYEERKHLFELIYHEEIESGRMLLAPLYDRENPADDLSWGKYYMECIRNTFGEPDLLVYGDDKERSRWFTREDLIGVDELVINRLTNPINATSLRMMMVDGEEKSAKLYFRLNCPAQIWNEYNNIKNTIMEVNS